jgi:hypothetical protein
MRGHIRRGRIDGTWYLRVELPRDMNGKRQQRREVFRGTKVDAQRQLRQLLRDIEMGGYADGGRITLAELATRWLLATENRVAARTYTGYYAMTKLHMLGDNYPDRPATTILAAPERVAV